MPCTLSNARARHVPVNACPPTGSCCDTVTSFSSQQVCCGESFDQDWTPYDIQITASITNPVYTQDPDESYGVYKVVGKSLFVKFVIVIDNVGNAGNGNGIYSISLPSGFSFSKGNVGNILLNTRFGMNSSFPIQGMLFQISNTLQVAIPSTETPPTVVSQEWTSTNLPIVVGANYFGDIHIRLL